MKNIQKWGIFVSLLSTLILSGQETHYWFHNFGAVSSLKGGIEVGGIRNVAAIYYNPGALAFIEGQYFEGQADVLSIDALNIENAGGELIDLEYFSGDIAPSILAYLKRSKKNEDMTFAFGAMTRYNSNLSFIVEHEQEGNYLSPDERSDIFQGQLRYDNRIRESWLMGSFAYKLSERIGFGLGTYFFVRTQDYFSSYVASAFPKDELDNSGAPFTSLTSNIEEKKYNGRVTGFIFRPAIDVDFDELKLGLTLTTPALSIGLLNNYAFKYQLAYLPDEETDRNYSDSHDKYSGVYKTPLSINFGAEYDFGKLILAFTTEWFAKVDKYTMIKKNDKSIDTEFPTAPSDDYAFPMMAHKSVTNFGFSAIYEIKESFSIIGSFRTDMNFFDEEALSRADDFVPNMTYWDLYHFTAGIKMSSEKIDLTLGVDYGNGNSQNDPQFVNMTTAAQSNFLRGEINNNTSTQYQNVSLTIGVKFDLESSNESK